MKGGDKVYFVVKGMVFHIIDYAIDALNPAFVLEIESKKRRPNHGYQETA